MLRLQTKDQAGLKNEQWDNYVKESDNGTIFQQQKFLSYHHKKRFNNVPLVYQKRDKIIALANFTLKKKAVKHVLSSYPGASWGGFVFKAPLTYQHAMDVCRLTIEYARKLGCSEIVITLPPSIYQDTPDDTLTFCLLKHGFVYLKRELTSVVDLRKKKVEMHRSVNKAVKKSHQAHIIVKEETSDWKVFYNLLKRNVTDKGSQPTHSLNELLKLQELYPENIKLWSAYKNDIYVGGLCNWRVKQGIWLVFYSCYDPDRKNDRILNRLFYESIQHYHQAGSSFVDFGTSTVNMQVNEGLINFKELYSAHAVFRDTIHLQL